MASTPNGDGPKYQVEAERWRVKAAPWVNGMVKEDADRILEFIAAINPDDYHMNPGEIGTKSHSTVATYAQNLRLIAKAAPKPLTGLTGGGLNTVFTDMDVANNTLSQRQATARTFYKYHDDLDVDPGVITINRPDHSPVEPRDLFTRAEVDAMHEVIDNPRDRAMVDLMLYTGQRVRAVLTLKVSDIDLESSRFYLDTSEAGLKGAEGMRPMLVAKGACADWMDYHPAPDDPDAYFITKLPDAAKGDVNTPLHRSTVQRRVREILEEAEIDRAEKRGHPHNFRHTFVRWAYINRGMDIQTIKYMTGHSKDSQTLERTYMNILESDFAQKAEEAAGVRSVDEPEDHLTPETCPICQYGPLPEDARACPRCTNILTPDGAQQRQEFLQDAESTIVEVDNEAEARVVQSVLQDIRENPEGYLDDE